MKQSSRPFFKWLVILSLFLGGFTATTAAMPATDAQATTVYVTNTGKHYFYNRHDRGLNRAKKVYAVSLNTAKKRGLTLSATEKAPKKVVKKAAPKKVVKKAAPKKIVKKATPKKVVKKATPKKVVKKVPAKQKVTPKKTAPAYKVTSVNNNRPTFNKATLSKQRGAWQQYGQLDQYNRATTANAMLNRRLMPTGARESLYVNPTAWHNKQISSGWLYNRSHLIAYQLTGQNNNLRNLITGTRQLNDPGMTKYENQVASYLKANANNYVRYQVQPVFKNRELLARGVKIQAQSIGSNKVSFNVYLPNTQSNMVLNYATGTSTVAK